MEVNCGRYSICQAAEGQGKYPPLSITPRWIIIKIIIVLMYTTHVEKMAPKTTLSVTINWKMIGFESFVWHLILKGEFNCIISSKLTNQHVPKALFATCVVYTKYVNTQWNVSILVLLQVAVTSLLLWLYDAVTRCPFIGFNFTIHSGHKCNL